jgi:serine/threonine protein phosphatase PrpC
MIEGSRSIIKLLAKDMSAPEIVALSGGTAAAYSCRCPGRETPNEDAAAVLQLEDKSVVLAVADGMGGGLAGEKASSLAVECIAGELEAYQGNDDQLLRTAIINGIEHAGNEVNRLGLGAATTLAVVQVQGRTVRPYHVGDSLVLVVGNKGKLKLQTIPHSPVGYAVEAGVLDEHEAMHHEDRHIVSNMVGADDMRIEVGAPLELAPRDSLVIASDGLSDNLRVDEAADLVRKGPLKQAVKNLVVKAHRRMTVPEPGCPSKPDDLTVLVFRVKPGDTSVCPEDLGHKAHDTSANHCSRGRARHGPDGTG